MFLKLKKCAHSSTYPTGIFFYVLSALYVFRPFLQRHARFAFFFFQGFLRNSFEESRKLIQFNCTARRMCQNNLLDRKSFKDQISTFYVKYLVCVTK